LLVSIQRRRNQQRGGGTYLAVVDGEVEVMEGVVSGSVDDLGKEEKEREGKSVPSSDGRRIDLYRMGDAYLLEPTSGDHIRVVDLSTRKKKGRQQENGGVEGESRRKRKARRTKILQKLTAE